MIYDRHNSLTKDEKTALEESADSQERIVLKILRGKPDKAFAYFDIKKLTGWDKDSVKRSLSDLSGSDDSYEDDYGRYPVEYDPDKRKNNPDTGKTCGTYKVNADYGKPKPLEGEQISAFGEVKRSRVYDV